MSEELAVSDKAVRITKAAVEAIYEIGLDKVKLTDVAKAAGVTTGAVTYYFEDKDALLIAAFELSCVAQIQEFREFEGGWCTELFEKHLPTTPLRRRQWAVWLEFSVRARTSKPMKRIYRSFYETFEATLMDLMGLDDRDRAKALAGKIIAAIDGVGLCATLNPQLWPPERQRQALADLMAPLVAEGKGKKR